VGVPGLLLLDEPSEEGIQSSASQAICRVLWSFRGDLGTTNVFVEQNLDTILALAERCMVADNRQIIVEIPAVNVIRDSARQHLLI
jgi:urea transport system ATP-binding protein